MIAILNIERFQVFNKAQNLSRWDSQGPSPSHHHFYICDMVTKFPVMAGKNDIVLPTLVEVPRN
jgi:hypothetical protein